MANGVVQAAAGTALISAAHENGHVIDAVHMKTPVKDKHLAGDHRSMAFDAIEALFGHVFIVHPAQGARIVADIVAVTAAGVAAGTMIAKHLLHFRMISISSP